MIASPGDVAAERNIVRDVCFEWNAIHSERRNMVILPVGWETHSSPSMGDRPQAILNSQILERCDLLVGIFWTRIGTSTGEYASGTVEEIEEHIASGKPAMLYFSSAPVVPESIDPEQYRLLREFRDSCQTRGLYETYADISDFRSTFYRQLQIKLNESYFVSTPEETQIEPLNDPAPTLPNLSREAQILLKQGSMDPNGSIIHLEHIGGLVIQTNGQGYVEENNPRSRALWEGALRELESLGLVSDRGYKREIFSLTREGFDVAEIINP